MRFQHSSKLWADFANLVAGVVHVDGISTKPCPDAAVARHLELARARLATGSESEFPEIQAWRRAFAQMGLKPTQYRCASESLLRRLRKEHALPRIHPLIDLCNAISVSFAIPIAALDLAKIAGDLEVGYATGDEQYVTFSGEIERPDPGEVVFTDAEGFAHARRWTNRQSGRSAVRDTTTSVLIVAEAMHSTAPADVPRLIATVAEEVAQAWATAPRTAILAPATPIFSPSV